MYKFMSEMAAALVLFIAIAVPFGLFFAMYGA
jgi:hypothetical protein